MNLTTTAIWLASIAAAIHVLLGALQSNTLNAWLATYSIPSLPPKAAPYLGLVLGLGAGFVAGLQQGDTIGYSIAQAFMGMITGGAASLHLESLTGNVAPPKPAPAPVPAPPAAK
jgi:hypothetical protein